MIRDDELEGLLSLYERGELDEERSAAVRRKLDESAEARTLLAGFERLSELCEAEQDEVPELPARVAARVLDEVHAAMEGSPEVRAGELPDILTVEEVARYFRVTREELEAEMASMPFFEFGGRLRMRRESLLSWVENREQWTRRQRLMSLPSTGAHEADQG